MTVYRSDKLIKSIEKISDTKFNAAQKSAMRKVIREMFVNIHLEACDATIMAINKRTLIKPNFYD